MKTLIGYLVFVSYNRDQYELAEIALDDMTLKEFIHFSKNDSVNCMNVNITPIYDTTEIICNGSEVADDSVVWFVAVGMAHSSEYKDFFNHCA